MIYVKLLLKQKKPDHQRWRYSTVIHLEQSVHLAKRQDLKKEKRKEQIFKIELLK